MQILERFITHTVNQHTLSKSLRFSPQVGAPQRPVLSDCRAPALTLPLTPILTLALTLTLTLTNRVKKADGSIKFPLIADKQPSYHDAVFVDHPVFGVSMPTPLHLVSVCQPHVPCLRGDEHAPLH